MTKQLLAGITLLAVSVAASAQILHYTDSNGRKIYVDSLSKVPPEYQDQLRSKQTKKLKLSDERQAELAQQQQQMIERSQVRREQSQLEKELRSLETPIVSHSGRMVVEVKVVANRKRKTLRLVVDTGASRTVVYRNQLEPLGLTIRPSGLARVAGGATIKTFSGRLDQLELGPISQRGVEILMMEQSGGYGGYDGLLGMDFLSRTNYRPDYQRNLLIWKPARYDEITARLEELMKPPVDQGQTTQIADVIPNEDDSAPAAALSQ